MLSKRWWASSNTVINFLLPLLRLPLFIKLEQVWTEVHCAKWVCRPQYSCISLHNRLILRSKSKTSMLMNSRPTYLNNQKSQKPKLIFSPMCEYALIFLNITLFSYHNSSCPCAPSFVIQSCSSAFPDKYSFNLYWVIPLPYLRSCWKFTAFKLVK